VKIWKITQWDVFWNTVYMQSTHKVVLTAQNFETARCSIGLLQNGSGLKSNWSLYFSQFELELKLSLDS